MHILDTQTVLFSYAITSIICVLVMIFLWQQNRKRFRGLDFWLYVYIIQLLAVLLFALRGRVPDFFSIVIPNTLVVGGTLLLYMGLERYVGKTSLQYHNYLLLAVFIGVHTYFTEVHPSQALRNLNTSLSLLVVCSQCAWLMLRRVEGAIRSETRLVGLGFAIYCLALLVRVFLVLAVPASNDLVKSGLLDTLVLLIYQLILVALAFGLFLMVNRRLFAALEDDIAARKQIEQTQKASEERYRTLVDNLGEGIGITREDERFSFANPSAHEIFGVPPGTLVGRSLSEFLDASSLALIQKQTWERQQDKSSVYEMEIIRPDGEHRRLQVNARPQVDENGHYLGTFGLFRDITERKFAEEMLQHQSTHDILTGLFNRQHYENEIVRLQMGWRFPITILMMDVDGLKQINDSLGHQAGDDLLRRVAQVLKNTFRPEDLVARMGGDEFVVVLPNTNVQTADQVVQRLKDNLEKYNQTLPADQVLKVSIGKAWGDQSSLLSEIYKQADRDMYRSKAENKI